jgi:hypothetical protein
MGIGKPGIGMTQPGIGSAATVIGEISKGKNIRITTISTTAMIVMRAMSHTLDTDASQDTPADGTGWIQVCGTRFSAS